MKTTHLLLAGVIVSGFLAACSAPSPSGEGGQMASTAQTPPPPPASSPETSATGEALAKRASATGVIEAIDPAARTITISHGPVPTIAWPAMTMTFQAQDVDLAGFKVGDRITFEFSASGMTARLTGLITW